MKNAIHSRFLATAVAMCLAAPSAEAQVRVDATSVIEVWHSTKEIKVPSSEKPSRLDTTNTFEVREVAKTRVVIGDNNPLLFTYSTTVTETQSDDDKAAASFLTTLAGVVSGFRGGGGGDAFEVEGLNFAKLVEDIRELDGRMGEIPSALHRSLGTPTDVAALRNEVSAWDSQRLTARLTKSLQSAYLLADKCNFNSDVALVTNKGGMLKCDEDLEGALHATIGTQGGDSNPPNPTDAPVKDSQEPSAKTKPGAITKAEPPRLGRSAAREGAPAEISKPGEVAAVSDALKTTGTHVTIRGFLTALDARGRRLEAAIAILQGFAADIQKLHTAVTVDEADYGLKVRSVKIKVAASGKYDAFLRDDTKRDREAQFSDYTIVIRPYSPVKLGVAPAAVLAFITNPTYKATAVADGFRIDAEDEDATTYNLAAMLTITPRPWSQPTFGGSSHLGLSPTKNRVGFYFGGSMNVQKLFSFGGGVTWQQTDQLATGLEPGQVLKGPDELKVRPRFRPGGYIHIAVNVK